MNIVLFNSRYRDDLIYMVLDAKNALGRVPTLNEDLLDIQANYFNNGEKFWIAVDESDRVVGCIGTRHISDHEIWLKRLYVKADRKRQGIGSALLQTVEAYAREKNIDRIHTHFSADYCEAQQFYPKHGFVEIEPFHSVKDLI